MKRLIFSLATTLLTSISFGQSVGIGTLTPQNKLHLVGDFRMDDASPYINFYSGTTQMGSIGFWSDNNLSIINRGATSPILFATDATERMRITADGYVGIGTQTPTQPLTVYNANSAWAAFQTSVTGQTINDGLLIGHTGYNAYVRNLENNPLYFSTNDNIRLSIAADGNVGIGTLTPTRPLTVYATTASYAAFQYSGSGNGVNDGVIVGAEPSGGYLWNHENTPLAFATNNERRMTIHANGNVGIGTTTPSAGLHLKGNTFPSSFMYITSNTGNDSGFRLYEGASDKWHIYNNGTTQQLNFRNNDFQPNMIIDQATGNVGIGTENPTYNLTVAGSIRSEENNLFGAAVSGIQTSIGGQGGYFEASGSNGEGVRASGGLWDFYATGSGGDYGSGSSIRWKENVVTIAQPLQKIGDLRGVFFDWDSEHGGQHDIGFIAEEVGEVLPEIVVYEENGIDAIGLDYSKLSPLLVEAVKALITENEKLKQRLDAIENKLNEMHGN